MLALKDEKLAYSYFADCEKLLDVLEYEIKNMRSREIFWNWIDSVLEINAKENEQHFTNHSLQGDPHSEKQGPVKIETEYLMTLERSV